MSEDVYDVGVVKWCNLCQEPHSPCERHDDGGEYHFEEETS